MSYASTEEIRDYLDTLSDERNTIEETCMDICFHMKGVSWNEAWGMSAEQRSGIIKYVNKVYQEREEAQTGKKSM